MKFNKYLFSIFLFLFLWEICMLQPYKASCQIPRIMSFQGIVNDAQGNVKPNGTYYITISIYTAAVGGTAVWTHANHSIDISEGVFSTTIGGTGQPLLHEFNRPYWLGIQFEGEAELIPRIQIVSVAYSLNSIYSDSAGHSNQADNATHAEKADSSDYSNDAGEANHAAKSDSSDYSTHAAEADTADFSHNSQNAAIADSAAIAKRSHRADSADYAPTSNLPIGVIIAFAGAENKIPTGWLLCDGRALKSTEYFDLSSTLGTSWGDGSDDTDDDTDFNLPDLRGMFLRGVDNAAGIDPDSDTRQAIKDGGNMGDTVGTVQAHATTGASFSEDPFNSTSSFDVQYFPKPPDAAFSTSSFSGNETRPVNVYVYYIIKAK